MLFHRCRRLLFITCFPVPSESSSSRPGWGPRRSAQVMLTRWIRWISGMYRCMISAMITLPLLGAVDLIVERHIRVVDELAFFSAFSSRNASIWSKQVLKLVQLFLRHGDNRSADRFDFQNFPDITDTFWHVPRKSYSRMCRTVVIMLTNPSFSSFASRTFDGSPAHIQGSCQLRLGYLLTGGVC